MADVGGEGAIVAERVIACRSDRARLWDVVADTERLNRAVGLRRIALAPSSGETAARFVVRTVLGGFDVEYDEVPFEWVVHERFRSERRMRSGPLTALETTFTFEPRGERGTSVTVRVALTPRWRLLAPILRLRAAQTVARFEREIRRLDEALAASQPLPAVRTPVDPGALARAAQALRARADADLAERLVGLVAEGADVDVARIRPFDLADRWSAPRRAVLATCLHAVRAGLLELRWEVVCPSCRTGTEALPTLSALSEHGTCQLCELEFALDLDEAVEATFGIARAVRSVDVGPYCIGGPVRTPHVHAQALLPGRGEARLPAPDEEGRYRLFVRGLGARPVAVSAGAPAELAVEGGGPNAGGGLAVAPRGTVVVTNRGAEERHAKLERAAFAHTAATARIVTAMPEFRREFSADVLRAGTALKVSRVGLLFSDLVGSTELYSTAGDAAAFRLVHDHFDLVIGLVERHGGALVKTIGDAVMAAFADDLDGLDAAVAILRAFETFRARGLDGGRTHIKLGVFGGPCYAVTANGVLDYFGQTVNVAARLQSEARSGELVVTAELADAAIADGRLDASSVRERYDARLKGIDAPVRAARVVAC
jgi:class 3 adenylate cyclase